MARPRRRRDPIQGVRTEVTAFVGSIPAGAPAGPFRVTSVSEYRSIVGTVQGETGDALRLFFDNDGRDAYVVGFDEAKPKRSLAALADIEFNLLVIPATARLPDHRAVRLAVAAALLAEERHAFYLVDPPAHRTVANVDRWAGSFGGGSSSGVYFPRVRVRDQSGERDVPASAAVAGALARIDRDFGVWPPPGTGPARVRGIVGPTIELDEATVEDLTQAGINTIRSVPTRGPVVWGGRTRADTDTEWQYVSVKRFFLFLERSIVEGLQWVVFEPNDEPLWRHVRSAVRPFLDRVFRSAAFPASRPQDAFFVRCDRTTMTHDDIEAGRLVMHVGFAPLRPVEFLVVRICLRARRT